ncbi:hypothetical protein AB0K00_54165 [Dactylosporangium sp. NPDC049525]|uniref:hypothetical protein n=1 Tax=Dactylosporangium sp. NPDC049525 TaxID=3154730 RepID=UPI0034204BE3
MHAATEPPTRIGVGCPIIARFHLSQDAEPLFTEAMRVLCLKSAVYELTGEDEEAAELVVSAPVDEMVHAVLTQYTLCQAMTRRLGIRFVHMTDRERFGWRRGDYTSQCYEAAGWGEPPARYWIDADETRHRLRVLNDRYTSIGIFDDGCRHEIDFDRDRDRDRDRDQEPAPAPASGQLTSTGR